LKARRCAPVAGEDTLVEIGGKDTVEAFSQRLRGAKPGQELKAEVIYPADYAEAKLAGKTVAYDVEVKAIKKRTLPELDDDFAKELGAYESLPIWKSASASTWPAASAAAWKARPRTGCLPR
jgi:trigger factor